MATIDFVTGCKGRLSFLQQMLPAIVGVPDSTCTVVDYSCPDQTGDWVEANYPSVRVVRVPGEPRYDFSRAKNLGAQGGSAPWLCFIDCDIVLDAAFAPLVAQLESGGFYRFLPVVDPSCTGTFLCPRSTFEQIGGFDEALRSYGGEDLDIYDMLHTVGLAPRSFPSTLIRHIHHKATLRTQFQELDSIHISETINRTYREIKYDLIRLGATLGLESRKQLHQSVHHAVLTGISTDQVMTVNCLFRVGQLPVVIGPKKWRVERSLQYVIKPD